VVDRYANGYNTGEEDMTCSLRTLGEHNLLRKSGKMSPREEVLWLQLEGQVVYQVGQFGGGQKQGWLKPIMEMRQPEHKGFVC
jgi:hypothetical protein